MKRKGVEREKMNDMNNHPQKHGINDDNEYSAPTSAPIAVLMQFLLAQANPLLQGRTEIKWNRKNKSRHGVH